MHILIFEVALSGHHANYLEHSAALFLSQGHRVTVSVLNKHLSDPLFDRLQTAYPDQLVVHELPTNSFWLNATARLGVVGSELKHWLLFRLLFNRLKAIGEIDHVFFPYLDYCLHAIALLGSPTGRISWSGICMRPSFHYCPAGLIAPTPKWGFIKERLFCKLLQQRGLATIFTIDQLLKLHVNQKHPALAQRLVYAADPAELNDRYNQASARKLIGIAPDAFVILVYGAIDARKGIFDLLDGIRRVTLPRKVQVLVVGKQTSAMSDLTAQDPLVTSINHYVDSDIEEAAFRAADAVWMGYRAHYGMSGVLVLAAMASKPVLATRNGLIGWMTRQHALGIAIDCEDPGQVIEAVHSLINQASSSISIGMESIQQRHTWQSFNRTILHGTVSKQEH